MAGITLQVAEAQLAQWIACMTAIASNQRYKIADREYVRADLMAVQKTIDYWDNKVKALDLAATGGNSGRIGRARHGW